MPCALPGNPSWLPTVPDFQLTVGKILPLRSVLVTLTDPSGQPGGGMQGNPSAIIAPRLPVSASPAGRIQASAFLLAVRTWNALPDAWQEPRGVRVIPENPDQIVRHERLVTELGWPEEWLRLEDGDLIYGQSGCVAT